jgi:hypothetical protein
LILAAVAATAAYPLLGRRVVIPWTASLLIDLDHVPDYARQHGPASLPAIWRHFRSGNGEGRLHRLHRWPTIL